MKENNKKEEKRKKRYNQFTDLVPLEGRPLSCGALCPSAGYPRTMNAKVNKEIKLKY